MKVVVFEDDALDGLGPLTALRHASLLRWGTKTLLEAQGESVSDATDLALWGRDWLADATREATGKRYNEREEGTALLVNAAAKPGRGLLDLTSRKSSFAAYEGSRLVAARLGLGKLVPGVVPVKAGLKIRKGIDSLEVPEGSLLSGYWDLIEGNGLKIAEQARRYSDTQSLPPHVEVRGPGSNVRIEGGADVESHVTFDARLGPIVIEKGASVESFSRVMGPCFIGKRAKILSGLIGGGTSIFEGCKIGGQVENSVVMPFTNKAHHGYVGDSYVGEWVNLGAGSTFSNLKNTYGSVRVELGGRSVDTGMVKLGPVVGDMCKVSVGALVYSGKALGTASQVAGLASTNVPSFAYHDGFSGRRVELLIESVLETQRRMMVRRDKELTRSQEALVRHAFKATALERKEGGAKKGRIT